MEGPDVNMQSIERDHRGDIVGRWTDLDYVLMRDGPSAGPGFEPGEDTKSVLMDVMHVLVLGAGGLGCELLKDLALSGFKKIDVIDMDTIDLSNLNRQFLFRPHDIGKPKAIIAAERVMERVEGVTVTPHYCRIEDKDDDWFQQFHIIIMGLDSLEARSYMNAVACSFLRFEADGTPDQSTIKPLIDGGTEGWKGHARVILPGVTPCFHCTMWLFPPQTTYPLCTLAETPRIAAHCIEYAHLIQWGNERPNEEFDADDPEHMKWIYENAMRRAEAFGIEGVTLYHTMGVVKNIIPAIPSTNAIIAGQCALEALKMATMCAKGMDNFMMYNGSDGVYTHTVAYEKDPDCPMCSPGVAMELPKESTLSDVIDAIVKKFEDTVALPSISTSNGTNLYMRGVLEEATRDNLPRKMSELLGEEHGGGEKLDGLIIVNDKKLKGPLRVRLSLA